MTILTKILLAIPCLLVFPMAYGSSYNNKNDSTFTISGKVADSISGRSLHLVSIYLSTDGNNSATIKTVMTDEKGGFKLEHNSSPFYLKFSLIGYEPLIKKFEVKNGFVLDIGTIALKQIENKLKEVTITAKKPVLELINGGYRFNAGNNIIGASTNMAELLKQVPGVVVDEIQGKIELLGRGPSVLINGRKVNISGQDLLTYLKSLPSNEILSINVLTSPGAEYDAADGGGVLDIRLKKRSELGFYGSASTSIYTLWRTDESVNLNLKMDKLDFSLGYNFSVGKNLYRRNDVIKNYSLADTSYLFLQNQVSDRLQRTHSVKANVIYKIDTTSAISVNYWYAYLYDHSPNHRNSEIFNKNDNLQRRLMQIDTSVLNNDFYILDVVYDKEFGPKSRLSVGLNYSNYQNQNTTFFNRQAYNIDGAPRNSFENESRDLNVRRPYQLWALNADYSKGLGKHYEIKLGAKYNTAKTKSGFQSFIIADDGGRSLDDRLSNDIAYDENIKTAYSTLSGNFSRFSFNVGLRLESFDYTLRSLTINEQIGDRYTNLFPNASVRYESKNKNNSVSLSANRRIDRPSYSLLNPFVLNDNVGYVSSGNPNLRPYFTNRLDVQFSHRFGNDHSMIFAIYGSSSKDIYSRITRYNAELGTPEINSYNDYNMKQIGSYLMLNNRFWDKVNVSTYLSLQRPSFSSNIPEDFLLSGITNFMGNMNMFINVLPKTTVQVLGFYTSHRNSFQTRNGPSGYVTFGIQQKALSNKMNIALSLEDVFNTQKFPVSMYSDFLSMESLNKLTTRFLKLSLTYNFGKSFKSRQTRNVEKDSRVN
ncbi:MAG: outer membrane beta-barrel family protein [Bacteroidota bacterium]